MSDEEKEYSEEEEEEEEEEKQAEEEKRKAEEAAKKKPPPPVEEKKVEKSEAEIALEEKFKKKAEGEEDQWREYIEQWRRQRAKEEEELKRLREKQEKRRELRQIEEQKYTEEKRRAEEKRARDAEEKKIKDQEEKKRRLEDAEKKRQSMQKAMETQKAETKPNFVVQKARSDAGPGASIGTSAADRLLNVAAARGELGKTKEQLAEDKKISLSFRIKELEIEGLSVDALKEMAKTMWEQVVKLETEKYDLEERQKRQDYDLKELNERQRQINRNKALKKGLDPEALQGKHPPKIQVASKYERRIDRRSYADKKQLFNGGWESSVMAAIEKTWMDKIESFEEKKGKLPKWLGGQAEEPAAEEAAPEPVAEEEEEEEE